MCRAAGLPVHSGLTPFSRTASLDDWLAARGWAIVDPTLVLVRDQSSPERGAHPDAPPHGLALRHADAAEFAQVVGGRRGSSEEEIAAHAERLRLPPVPHREAILWDGRSPVAYGQKACEATFAGISDVTTAPA